LIVVDNGSEDGSTALVEEFGNGVPFLVSLVRHNDKGLSKARNAGLARSRGELITFTDDDCYVTATYLADIVNVFDRSDLGCIGGRILLFDPEDARETILDSEEAMVLEAMSFVEPGFIHGANMAVRREVFEKIGAFDPRLGAGTRFHCGEDTDLLARASAAGFRIGYNPKPTIFHHHGRRPGGDVTSLRRGYDVGRGAYYAKSLATAATRSMYLKNWYWAIRSCVRQGNYRTPLREMWGALRFAFESARGAGVSRPLGKDGRR
jgi:GT2 family glycosyltransferase